MKLYEWRCNPCNKLLARHFAYGYLEIKCTRCGAINRQKAQSLPENLGDSNDKTSRAVDRRQA